MAPHHLPRLPEFLDSEFFLSCRFLLSAFCLLLRRFRFRSYGLLRDRQALLQRLHDVDHLGRLRLRRRHLRSAFGFLPSAFCFGASASEATGFFAIARLFFSASMMSITLDGSACGGVTTSWPLILASISACRFSR